ncbi:MAG: LemA family protein [Lachnospiraceae bacterium]
MVWILAAVIALVLLALAFIYNSLVRRRNQVEEAFSTMDVCLNKRYDLIPNLVDTVKRYASHERTTLEKIVRERNLALTSKDPTEVIRSNAALGQSLSHLIAMAENYPDLQASKNFVCLQEELEKVEEDIANARHYYNGCVRLYNDAVLTFPSNLAAKLFGFRKAALYEVPEREARKPVRVAI